MSGHMGIGMDIGMDAGMNAGTDVGRGVGRGVDADVGANVGGDASVFIRRMRPIAPRRRCGSRAVLLLLASAGLLAACSDDVDPAADAATDAAAEPSADAVTAGDGTGTEPYCPHRTAGAALFDGMTFAEICAAPDPGLCRLEAPGPATPGVTPVAQPDASCCADWPVAFMVGADLPPQSLGLEIGAVDPDGHFVPYVDGGWLPLVRGVQGGFHVYVGARIDVPGSQGTTLKLQAGSVGLIDCAEDAYGVAPVVYAKPDIDEPKKWVLGSATKPGLYLIFPGKSPVMCGYCGRWLDIRLAVKDLASGGWAYVRRQMRLYDPCACEYTNWPLEKCECNLIAAAP